MSLFTLVVVFQTQRLAAVENPKPLISTDGLSNSGSIETWDDFQNLIIQNNVTNVDQLLEKLPSNFINGFSLIYRTRALNQQLVSPRRPRVLMFGQNARFVLIYNSHLTGGRASKNDVETVETLTNDPKTGRSYLRELTFRGGKVPSFAGVQTNPQKCLACHAVSSKILNVGNSLKARGLWDPYNSWTGVYGSLSRNDVDFIHLASNEAQSFQLFLKEKEINPRYQFLPLQVRLLSQVPDEIKDQQVLHFNLDLSAVNDALTFKAGLSSFPNQLLGMHLAEYNFLRLGNVLALQDRKKRAAFQYLAKGISLDEGFIQRDSPEGANATDLLQKPVFVKGAASCIAKMKNFIPDNANKIAFDQFGVILLEKMRTDYRARKVEVEKDNMGLSRISPGNNVQNPFDENRKPRGLNFDSINPSSRFHLLAVSEDGTPGNTGNAALQYLLYLMDFPQEDISTAVTRGNNVAVDIRYTLTGNTNLYYGESPRCYTNQATIKSAVFPYNPSKTCFSEGVEEFFTQYLPKSFYQNSDKKTMMDENIDQMNCDQLAEKSRQALKEYFQQVQ